MKLFHYHYWTLKVKEMENFYIDNGFTVISRQGMKEGKLVSLNPPLSWADFEGQEITFRIIEMRKGSVNVTFGYGKKDIFDHIGFLTTLEEHHEICQRAKEFNFQIDESNQRTFIKPNLPFRIELQYRDEYRNLNGYDLEEMEIEAVGFENDSVLLQLFNDHTCTNTVNLIRGQSNRIRSIRFNSQKRTELIDPTGVRLINL